MHFVRRSGIARLAALAAVGVSAVAFTSSQALAADPFVVSGRQDWLARVLPADIYVRAATAAAGIGVVHLTLHRRGAHGLSVALLLRGGGEGVEQRRQEQGARQGEGAETMKHPAETGAAGEGVHGRGRQGGVSAW